MKLTDSSLSKNANFHRISIHIQNLNFLPANIFTEMTPKANTKKYTILLERLDGCCDNGQASYDELVKFREQFLADEKKQQIIAFLEAIGNQERYLIMESLRDQARCVCELEALLQKSQPTISHHLRVLEKQGLILGMKKGKFTFYSLVRRPYEKMSNEFSNWVKQVSAWFGENL